MKRVKLGDGTRESSPSPTNENVTATASLPAASLSPQHESTTTNGVAPSSTGAASVSELEQPLIPVVPVDGVAKTNEDDLNCDSAADPAMASDISTPPQFRSALLQSMMGRQRATSQLARCRDPQQAFRQRE